MEALDSSTLIHLHVIQEEEGDTGACNCIGLVDIGNAPFGFVQLAVAQQDGDQEVAKALTRGGVHDHLPSAPSFNVGDPDGGEDEV